MRKENTFMNKIMHIVGNRPQFIKLAPISRELHNRGYQDLILHTGQHYDENMSNVFFEELSIEKPYCNLNIGSGTHAETTARALIAIEKELISKAPNIVIVYGDTNSTLAAAIAARKLNIQIVHVEAGPRTHHKDNPEECNRIMVDHISNLLCCPDRYSVSNLQKEGIGENAHFTGDVMYDTFLYSKARSESTILEQLEVVDKEFILMTWHRQENTQTKKRMENILSFLEQVNKRVVCPLHPRTKHMLEQFELIERAEKIIGLTFIEPVGYYEMVKLMSNCSLILTDSGGLSKESYFAGVKCLFMLDLDIWTDLLNDGWIIKLDFKDEESVHRGIELSNRSGRQRGVTTEKYYGDGHAASVIVDLIEIKLKEMEIAQ